jgi:hypothetical protein
MTQGNDTYETMASPAFPGQIRRRAWRWLIRPLSPYDDLWVNRAKAYWQLQERRFGVEFDVFTMALEPESDAVVTYARVKRVLPGRRVSQRQHEAPQAVQ